MGLNAATRQFDGKIAQDAKLQFNLQHAKFHHDASRKAANVALENVNFTMSVADTTATSAETTITPNDSETLYMYSCVPLAAYDTLTETDIAASFQETMDYYILMYYYYSGVTFTYGDFAMSGAAKDTITSLEPGTEYVLFAYVMDTTTGLAASAFDTIHFTTKSIPMSENVITMNYINDTLYIATTNDDPYFFIFESQDDYDYYQSDLSDESVKAELEEWIEQADQYSMTGYLTFSGDTAIAVADFYTDIFGKDLTSDDYISLAAPFAGLINGAVAYHQFYYTEPTIVCTDTVSVHIISPTWTDQVASYGWWQVTGSESADSLYWVSLSNSDTESVPGTYAKEDMDMDYSMIYVGETKAYFSTLTVTIAEENGYYIITAEGAAKNKVYYRLTFDPILISGTGIEEIAAPMINNAKMLINGNVVIRHDDHLYNLQGAQLK